MGGALSFRWLVPALCALLHVTGMLRFYRRFVFDEHDGSVFGLADDVYISACFGRSLFAGTGFLWYPGAPRIEGVSNPLWSALIGALHWLPGFSEARLGAFVIGLNALLLTAAWFLFWRSLLRARELWSDSAGSRTEASWLALLLVPMTIAIDYWSAEGFEVVLLAVLALGMLWLVLGATTRRSAIAAGVTLAAGLATRMDFALLALPTLLIIVARSGLLVRSGSERDSAGLAARRAQLAHGSLLLGTAGVLVLALLLARYAYYGSWLPNTYYLKATGWPLEARLARGVDQNLELLTIVPLPLLGLLVPRVRAHVWRRAPHAIAAWLGLALTVVYSTYVGGDAWRPFGGYDRHTAVGGLLLVWGLAALILSYASRWRPSLIAAALSCALAAWPVVRVDFARLQEGLWSENVPVRQLERDWIRYGKAFERISRPGARIAVCPAGAIVYFSHRGGVDLLGKVDDFVAHLPVSTRKPKDNACWRGAPGHNKEDDVSVFALRQPEFSRYRPPPQHRPRYVKIKHEGMQFFALRDTPYLAP